MNIQNPAGVLKKSRNRAGFWNGNPKTMKLKSASSAHRPTRAYDGKASSVNNRTIVSEAGSVTIK